MKLSIVLPACNEAESITGVLEGFSRYFLTKHLDHEIIVVNDGSHDSTSEHVKNFAATHSSVRLVEHLSNQGYGAALRFGFSAASGDFIFFTDSDGQFWPEDLDQTLPLMNAKTIVLGYREHRAEGRIRRLNAWLWSWCIQTFLHFHVRDLNCAWKLFPRSVLDDVKLVSTGAFINAELLYYAHNKNLAFQEIPVRHFPRHFGSATGANLGVIFRAFQELFYFLRNK